MIQLKTPYKYIKDGLPIVGTLKLEIVSWVTYKEYRVYTVEHSITDTNGAKHVILTRDKIVNNQEVNQLAELVAMDLDTSQLSKTESEWAEAKAALLPFVQNDLLEDAVHTVWDMLPDDWERSPELK